jgi:uncharacterized phage protein (TIGR01671 family)
MRKIKFRVYSTELKKYFTLQEVALRGLVMPVDNKLRISERYILEQFTGLYDKNNKEIYEGDILETTDYKKIPNSLEHQINALPIYVIFEDGSFRARWLNEKQTLKQDKPYQLLSNALDQPFLRQGLEVIGNIHEGENK